ncbi:hypothetical protein ACPESN_02925 [Stutzerimonas marianensis]|uniref:hypothetical protein n=1 Tax=Stutzerimonas marianensis TaxID=2929513 RepID=UPI003C2D4426
MSTTAVAIRIRVACLIFLCLNMMAALLLSGADVDGPRVLMAVMMGTRCMRMTQAPLSRALVAWFCTQVWSASFLKKTKQYVDHRFSSRHRAPVGFPVVHQRQADEKRGHDMTRYLMIPLLTVIAAAHAAAQEEGLTLQQERDRIGARMEAERRETGREINAIREPEAARQAEQAPDTGAVPSNRAIGPRAASPQQSGATPGLSNDPVGDPDPAQPGAEDSPITTTGPGISTTGPGTSTTTGTPGESSPRNGANGNAGSAGGAPAGGIGTSSGNGNAGPGGTSLGASGGN